MLAKRVSELDDYETSYATTVYFDTGSAELSAKAKSELDDIAQMRRVLTPAGYGETRSIGDQTTEAGRAKNRRAEVKVLVNRTLAAK